MAKTKRPNSIERKKELQMKPIRCAINLLRRFFHCLFTLFFVQFFACNFFSASFFRDHLFVFMNSVCFFSFGFWYGFVSVFVILLFFIHDHWRTASFLISVQCFSPMDNVVNKVHTSWFAFTWQLWPFYTMQLIIAFFYFFFILSICVCVRCVIRSSMVYAHVSVVILNWLFLYLSMMLWVCK